MLVFGEGRIVLTKSTVSSTQAASTFANTVGIEEPLTFGIEVWDRP
jgi:hypothetical protein